MTDYRPTILVTGPAKRFPYAWWATRLQLFGRGVKPVYRCPGNERPIAVNGVIIGGGNDIDPKHYGATGAAGAIYDAPRDALEMQVIESALKAQLPILGICRGAQLINVVLGGNLISDLRPLRKQTPNRNSIWPVKYAYMEKSSKLSSRLDTLQLKVNSLHHQAVDNLGDGLKVVARDADGFTQAFESINLEFLTGVQWHPEYMPYSNANRNLFRSFVDAVRQRYERDSQEVIL